MQVKHFSPEKGIFVENETVMFDKRVYITRRQTLAAKMREAGAEGLMIFIGNAEAPAQYKDNCYKFRQDSTWLYYFGIDQPMYAATIDLESGAETIFADDVEIGDIIWMGPQPSVQSIAEGVGVGSSAPYGKFDETVRTALSLGRKVHYINPSRYFNRLRLMALLGRADVEAGVSEVMTKAIISMRLVKEQCEIEEIDAAGELGQRMHTVARNAVRPGVLEQDIVGLMEGVTLSGGWGVSFPTILTQHGETLHNHLHDKIIEPGRLLVIDAGAEGNSH